MKSMAYKKNHKPLKSLDILVQKNVYKYIDIW